MATTYDRLHVLLREVQRNASRATPQNRHSFVRSIVNRKLPQFTIQRNRNGKLVEDSISDKAVERLLELLAELRLARLPEADGIEITTRGEEALEGENFANSVSVATFQLLSNDGVNRQTLLDNIDGIQPPNFADADTIHARLDPDVKEQLDLERFRGLLYLLACAGSIQREIKVFYAA